MDDYKSNTFTFDYNAESNGDTVLIQYTTTISNKHILKKLNNLTIKLALMIECAKTAYRNLFVLKDLDGTIEVPSSSLSSKVEMCCLLLANEDYIIDKQSGISSDYMDTSFKINKGFIVGYDNTYSFIVDKDKEDEFKASSIISVVKKLDLKDYMDIDLDNDNKIKIQLGDEMYQRFVQIQGQDKLPVVHSMIVLPALVYVIDQIKNKDLRETYSDYYWYRCIDKQLEVLNIGIDSSAFENKSSLAIAQELLKLPINHALINLTTEEGGE